MLFYNLKFLEINEFLEINYKFDDIIYLDETNQT